MLPTEWNSRGPVKVCSINYHHPWPVDTLNMAAVADRCDEWPDIVRPELTRYAHQTTTLPGHVSPASPWTQTSERKQFATNVA